MEHSRSVSSNEARKIFNTSSNDSKVSKSTFITSKLDNYRTDSKSWAANSAERYENIYQVGEGTYGKVYKAKEKNSKDHKFVALKCILMDKEKEGFPVTALREIMILKNLKHQNLINLLEIVSTKHTDKKIGNVYLVFEYMNHDLSGLLRTKIKLTLPSIKSIFYQILKGVNHLHKNNIIHRDIKSANILVSSKGEIKVGDFGLARKVNPYIDQDKNKFTNKVVTLWYRAPEILLGSRSYSYVSDVWSIGCMFLEILRGEAPFKGTNELTQVKSIFEYCGTPIIDINSVPNNSTGNSLWPEAKDFEFYSMYVKDFFPNVFEKVFRDSW